VARKINAPDMTSTPQTGTGRQDLHFSRTAEASPHFGRLAAIRRLAGETSAFR
jgi:hypothetical protein